MECAIAHTFDFEYDLLTVLVEYVSPDCPRVSIAYKSLILNLRIDLDDVDHRFLYLLLPIIYY